MRLQSPRLRTLLHFLLDGFGQFGNRGVSRSSNSSRSRRRRLAHGANANDSSCFRPASRQSRFLQRSPSLSATACNWFMIRVRACTIRCRCHSSCRRSRFSQLGTQIRGNDLRSVVAESAVHPGDPSSACVLACFGFGGIADVEFKPQF